MCMCVYAPEAINNSLWLTYVATGTGSLLIYQESQLALGLGLGLMIDLLALGVRREVRCVV